MMSPFCSSSGSVETTTLYTSRPKLANHAEFQHQPHVTWTLPWGHPIGISWSLCKALLCVRRLPVTKLIPDILLQDS